MIKKDKIDLQQPVMVGSHDVKLDADYAEWIAEVKHRYRSAQVKAAVKVNAEKLLWNWQMGRDLVQKKAEERWGAGIVEQVSLDLRREFPDSSNFSARNLWYMKQWYLFYTENMEKLKQLVSEMLPSDEYEKKLQQIDDDGTEKLKQPVSEFPLPFACVPWGHHIRIVQHSESVEEALFYVNYTIKEGISRDVLERVMKDNLYNTQGKAPNNFPQHLTPQLAQLALQVVKENYDFGFATVSQEKYDESELEEALHENITALLLEMGNGFAFLGKQREIIVGGRSRKIDLLFYHIRLRCYVVCELKAKPFEPEYAGKLNFYVNAVDELVKQSDDNPTIGLLICSDMNKADVQWSFKGISTPMGVATYNNIRIKDMLPTQEQLKERMELLKKELKHTKRLMNKTRDK
jgi:predicted nuclease of restriction endonuclease-like (RecB) superfamily